MGRGFRILKRKFRQKLAERLFCLSAAASALLLLLASVQPAESDVLDEAIDFCEWINWETSVLDCSEFGYPDFEQDCLSLYYDLVLQESVEARCKSRGGAAVTNVEDGQNLQQLLDEADTPNFNLSSNTSASSPSNSPVMIGD